MSKREITCARCGQKVAKEVGAINRAEAAGLRLFCSRKCSGLAKRTDKTEAQKKEEKRLYDIGYRSKNIDRIKRNKVEYFQRTYDPEKARIERKANMPRHVEYCRRAEYRAYKKEYDLNYRAKEFGEFAEAYKLFLQVCNEISVRASRYEIYSANGTLNKSIQRKRAYNV